MPRDVLSQRPLPYFRLVKNSVQKNVITFRYHISDFLNQIGVYESSNRAKLFLFQSMCFANDHVFHGTKDVEILCCYFSTARNPEMQNHFWQMNKG